MTHWGWEFVKPTGPPRLGPHPRPLTEMSTNSPSQMAVILSFLANQASAAWSAALINVHLQLSNQKR